MSTNEELACTYSALILADDDIPVTVSWHVFAFSSFLRWRLLNVWDMRAKRVENDWTSDSRRMFSVFAMWLINCPHLGSNLRFKVSVLLEGKGTTRRQNLNVMTNDVDLLVGQVVRPNSPAN